MNSTNKKQGQLISAKTLKNRRRRAKRREKVRELKEEFGILPGKIAGLEGSLASEYANSMVGFGPNATRSGVTPNQADPRTDFSIAQLGNTPGGRQAALKMLHPCMEECNAVIKIPDGAVSTSVSMERRDEYTVSCPTSDTTDMANWNCLVITLPFLVGRQLVMRWTVAHTPSEEQISSVFQEAMASVGQAAGAYPMFASSSIAGLSYLEFSILISSTLTPTIMAQDKGPVTGLIKSIRRSCLGVTTDLDASDLYNQGRVVSGQWSPDISLGTKALGDSTTTDVKSVHDVYYIEVPALTNTSVTSSDEFVRQAEAKDGSYMPIRPCAADWPLTAVQEWREIIADISGETAENYTPGTSNDLYLRGWSVGVSVWNGLDYRANLRLKVREDLEVVSAPDSTYSPFATPALPDDSRARQMVQEFCRKQPHDYPSDFNDLGAMLPNLLGGIGDAIGGLGIPLISPIAKTVSGVAKGPIGGLLGGLLGKLF